jgi:acetyltransferase-like isoleucine patch superfamily enzyme
MPITQATLDLLRSRNVFHRTGIGDRWRVGDPLLFMPDCRIEPYVSVHVGYLLPRALGAFTYSHSALPRSASVGRYCSIAAGVSWMADAHPMEWASMSPFSFDPQPLQGLRAWFADHPAPRMLSFDHRPAPVSVGHDVWIGEQAMIKGGVSIGDGAVVGARAVVTRDVPPYAIVAGVPARVVRMRFPEELAARLRALAWWRFAPDLLAGLAVDRPEAFVDELEARIADGAAPLDLVPLTGAEIAATLSR